VLRRPGGGAAAPARHGLLRSRRVDRLAPRSARSAWVPVAVWLGVIAVLGGSGFSQEETSRIIGPILRFLFPEWSPERVLLWQGLIRKAAHPTEYAVLGALLARALFFARQAAGVLRLALPALALAAGVASADEARQSLLANRTASVRDVGLDVAGATVGAFVLPLLLRRRGEAGGARATADDARG